MEKKNFAALFLAVFLVLGFSVTISMFWGSLFAKNQGTSLELVGFDRLFEQGNQDCFSLQVNSNFEGEMLQNLVVIANNNVVFREQIDSSQNPLLEKCILNEFLKEGDNFIEIYLGAERLFYHAEQAEQIEQATPLLAIGISPKQELQIRITNYNREKFAPVSIFVNNRLDHKIYFSGSSLETTEKISLENGNNEIRVEFEGLEQKTSAFKETPFSMNPVIGIAVMAFLLCVLAFLVFFDKGLFEKAAFSILSFFAIFCSVVFALNVSGLLSAINFSIATTIITIALAFIFRKNLSKASLLQGNWKAALKKASPFLAVLIGLILFSSFFFNLFTPSYFGIWTSFYERQSRTIMETQSIPIIDEYSFLGTKPFGYMTGYFFLNPGISWLTGLPTQQSYAIIMLLAQLSFLASALLFFRTFNLGRKAYLAVALCLFGGFMFSDFSFNIRHVVSYSFLLASLYFLRKQKGFASGITLGFGIFFQTPLALMFLALLPIVVTKKEMLREIPKALFLAAIIAGMLFAPSLIATGTPTQAKSDVWGYLWGIPPYGLMLDFISVFVLLVVFIVPFILLKKTRLDKFSLWILAFLAIYILVQMFVSYRINIVVTILFALLIATLFPKDFFREKISEYSLSMFFALGFSFLFIVIMAFYPVIPQLSEPFLFLKQNSSTNANILNEPWLGHPFIYFAERKSSADLAVEYAPEQMIDDSFDFIKENRPEILEKYNIDFVLNRSIFLDEKPVGSNLYKKLLEYEELDKIYSNGTVYVHWVDKERLGVSN